MHICRNDNLLQISTPQILYCSGIPLAGLVPQIRKQCGICNNIAIQLLIVINLTRCRLCLLHNPRYDPCC